MARFSALQIGPLETMMLTFFKFYSTLYIAACKTFNMAVAWSPRWRPLLSAAIVAAVAGSVVAKNVAQLSVPEIEDAIQVGIHSPGTQN